MSQNTSVQLVIWGLFRLLSRLRRPGPGAVKIFPQPGVLVGQHIGHGPNHQDPLVHQHGDTVTDGMQAVQVMGHHVRDRLAMGWSPEQISGRLKLEGSEHTISHGSIYRYIYRPKVRKEKLHRYLARAKARRGRRYFKRHRLPVANRRSIHDRPEGAENREEFGHWEGDLMQFRTQRGNLLTLCERMTRFLITASLKTKTASETGNVLRNIFHRLPEPARHTVTFDNGGEFAEHETLTSETGVQAFFCDPHSPWQRGAIENTNGVIRRDMPRKTDMADYSPADIDDIMWAVNSTPRKCLGYRTPAEAFLKNLTIALEM